MNTFFVMAMFLSSTLIALERQTMGVTVAHNQCRSACGNITIDYPFGVQDGCGHPGFQDLLFCMNGVLMFHINSGSYRVLDIDYAYRSLTLQEPHLSTCDTIVLGGRGNGFAVEQWRAPYFAASADNVFLLIGCAIESPLFRGFPDNHYPCRNVSGMGCQGYQAGCPAWSLIKSGGRDGSELGSGPPACCAVAIQDMKYSINLTELKCEGYSSAYSLAPQELDDARKWTFGIRVSYAVGDMKFCRDCETTGGTCGHAANSMTQLCMCGNFNATSSCDSVSSGGERNRVLHSVVASAIAAVCANYVRPTSNWKGSIPHL